MPEMYHRRNTRQAAVFCCERWRTAAERSEVGWPDLLGIFGAFLSTIGLGGAYGFYALFAAISGFCAWRFVRETKGRSLEEMVL